MNRPLPEVNVPMQFAMKMPTANGGAQFVYRNDELDITQIAYRDGPAGNFTVQFEAPAMLAGQQFRTWADLRAAWNARIEALSSRCCEKGQPGAACTECAGTSADHQRDMRADDDGLDLHVDVDWQEPGGVKSKSHPFVETREPHISHAWRWTDEGAMVCGCGAQFEDFGEQGHAVVGDPFGPCKGGKA